MSSDVRLRLALTVGLCSILLLTESCSRRPEAAPTRVYVDMDRLITLHPAYGLLALHTRPFAARVGGPRTLVGPSGPPSPASLRPFELVARRRPGSIGPRDASLEERLTQKEAQAQQKVQRMEARQWRLDAAVLAAERMTRAREAEERIRLAHNQLTREARRKLRDLDLRMIGLQSRLGSLAGGPQDRVEAAIRRTREERADVESRLAVALAGVRSAEFQRLRQEMEEIEASLERRREQRASAWTAEANRSLQAYRGTLQAATADLPVLEVPEAHAVGSGGTTRRPLAAARPPITMRTARGPEDASRWRAAIRADVALAARECALRRGWQIVTARSPHIPDRTAAVAEMVRTHWYGTSLE